MWNACPSYVNFSDLFSEVLWCNEYFEIDILKATSSKCLSLPRQGNINYTTPFWNFALHSNVVSPCEILCTFLTFVLILHFMSRFGINLNVTFAHQTWFYWNFDIWIEFVDSFAYYHISSHHFIFFEITSFLIPHWHRYNYWNQTTKQIPIMAITLMNLSILNSSIEDDNLTTGGNFSYTDETFLVTVSYLLIIIGFTAFVANFVIFLILVRKPNMLPSEMLVLCNLLIDSAYGINLFSVGFLNVNHILLPKIPSLQCIIRRVPYTFLIMASLLLLIIMTLNRYVAVKIPFQYKIVFKPSNVAKYLFTIFTVSTALASLDAALCIGDPNETHALSELFTLFWVYLKIVIIVAISILMFFIYKSISKQFVGNFYEPILLPFEALFGCKNGFCKWGRQEAAKTPLDTKFEMTTLVTHSPINVGVQRRSTEHAIPDLSNIEHANNLLSPHPIQSEVENTSRQEGVSNPGPVTLDHNGPVPSTATTPTSEKKGFVDNKNQNPIRLTADQIRERRKYQMTSMFFFISVTFIVLSVPNSVFQIISHLFENSVPISFSWKLYLVTETLYGLNFLLNPYLYSFNNSYLKERFETMKWNMSQFLARKPKAEQNDHAQERIELQRNKRNIEADGDVWSKCEMMVAAFDWCSATKLQSKWRASKQGWTKYRKKNEQSLRWVWSAF